MWAPHAVQCVPSLFGKECLYGCWGDYIPRGKCPKSGPFLEAGIRRRNRNAKSEPRLSGLTLCVPNLCPDSGLIFWSASSVRVHPKCGPVVWLIYGRKTRARHQMEANLYRAVGWYGQLGNCGPIVE